MNKTSAILLDINGGIKKVSVTSGDLDMENWTIVLNKKSIKTDFTCETIKSCDDVEYRTYSHSKDFNGDKINHHYHAMVYDSYYDRPDFAFRGSILFVACKKGVRIDVDMINFTKMLFQESKKRMDLTTSKRAEGNCNIL